MKPSPTKPSSNDDESSWSQLGGSSSHFPFFTYHFGVKIRLAQSFQKCFPMSMISNISLS